jgi:hypothetical protein
LGDEPSAAIPPDSASLRARRQLGRVLLLLAVLDVGVLVTVVLLAVLATAYRFTNLELLVLVVAGLGAIIGARVALAVRLKKRSGWL